MTALEDRIQRWEENTAIQELKFEYGRLIDAGLAGREAWRLGIGGELLCYVW